MFLKCSGVATVFLAGEVAGGHVKNSYFSSVVPGFSHDEIELSVKANFGSGFVLNFYEVSNNNIIAQVEHIENRYLVRSSDLSEWDIFCSSTI